jgi:hypothetical protein
MRVAASPQVPVRVYPAYASSRASCVPCLCMYCMSLSLCVWGGECVYRRAMVGCLYV